MPDRRTETIEAEGTGAGQMPCDAVAVTVAQIESPFIQRLASIRSVRERLQKLFEEHPDLDAGRLLVPDPQATPPRSGYSYYSRGVYVAIGETGKVTVKASRWTRPRMEALARSIKESMEDEMARALRQFVHKVVEANGGQVVSEAEEDGGGYSLIVEI